jgi:tetratricopeptide (TPR) repeat protein
MGAPHKNGRSRIWTFALVLGVLVGVGVGVWWRFVWVTGRPLRQAQAAYSQGDLPLAVVRAREALKEHPRDPHALQILARTSARLGDNGFARGIYENIPPSVLEAEDFYLLGSGLMRDNRQNDALPVLKKAYEKNPEHPETINALADLEAGWDHLSDATALAEKLVTVKGWETRGAVMLGLLRSHQFDPKGAAEMLGDALRRDPTLKNVASPNQIRKDYARALLASGGAEQARKALLEVLRAGSDPEASWLLSRAEMQRGQVAAAADAQKAAGSFADEQPDRLEPAAYVGAARCAECHRDIHRLSQGSRHAKTYRPGSDLAGFPVPREPIVDRNNPQVKSTLIKKSDGVHMETREGNELRSALITFAVGSGDRGLTPVGRDEAGRLRELRLSYYGDIGGWDRTTGHSLMPSDHERYLGVVMEPDDERRCLDCHTTNYRIAMDRTGPAAADRGIGCERCHGPAGNHLLAVAAKFPDPMIARPRLAEPEQVVNLCGQCHRPRSGRVDPTSPESIRFQAATLTWSRCYTATGKALSCATCHNPHHDADTSPSAYEPKCLACHSPDAPPKPVASARPSRHVAALPEGVKRVPCPVNPKTNCLECHMPTTRAAINHTVFTDHYIRIHRDGEGAGKPAE